MQNELEQKLVKKYPKLFKQHTGSIQETAMCWGFECDDGWYWIIDQLADSIQRFIDNGNFQQVETTQVKEKYGGLRFYTNIHEDTINGMIWLAEDLSTRTCELCGSLDGKYMSTGGHPRGWKKTLCTTCSTETEYKEIESVV